MNTKYTYGINAGDLYKEQTDSDGNIVCEEWFFKGKRHRLDGPAIKRKYGYDEYWVNGLCLSKEKFKLLKRSLVINKVLCQK